MIENLVASFIDPYTGKSLQAENAIARVLVEGKSIHIELTLGYPTSLIDGKFIALENKLKEVAEDYEIHLHLKPVIAPHTGVKGLSALPNIKNIIAVASGKGGVGKSFVANHLATALNAAGAKIGILDADIYGPSQPSLLNTKSTKPKVIDNYFIPIMSNGIQSMSMGYLVESQTAMVWRGPMIGKAMQQMLEQTKWDNLDYLIIDMPPGTGDIQLTLCQKMPVSGAVIITTPQDLALIDVRRACEMFNKMQVPILGVIENMSSFQCHHCGETQNLFGEGGGRDLAQENNIPLLGQIPLNGTLREMTDAGRAQEWQLQSSQAAKNIQDIAIKTAAALLSQRKDYSHKFPKIVVK